LNPADYAAVQAALARSQAVQNTNASNNTVASAMPDPNRSLTPYEAQSAEQSNAQNNAQTNAQSNAQSAAPTTNQQGSVNQSTEPTAPQVNDQARTNNVQSKSQLPASASPLPLIAVLGLIALAVGGIFTYRLRRNEA
jgi:cobalamin biosynthesis Mg chelatase CobN